MKSYHRKGILGGKNTVDKTGKEMRGDGEQRINISRVSIKILKENL